MAEAIHFLDFRERLEQLTDMEAVKEAYLAYVSSRFDSYRVFKTPSSLAKVGIHLSSYLDDASGLVSRWEECVHDELIFIVGPRGSLGLELAQWLEKSRATTLSRLERLLLEAPEVPGEDLPSQASFHHSLKTLAQARKSRFAALRVELGNASGLGPLLQSCLPPGSSVFAFTRSSLAALIPNCDELRVRWLTHRAAMSLTKTLIELEATERPAIGVASWPAHSPSLPMFVLSLQQALQDAIRVNHLPSQKGSAIIYANDWVSHRTGSRPDEDGGAGAPVRGVGPNPNLRGGAAQRLGDEGA